MENKEPEEKTKIELTKEEVIVFVLSIALPAAYILYKTLIEP